MARKMPNTIKPLINNGFIFHKIGVIYTLISPSNCQNFAGKLPTRNVFPPQMSIGQRDITDIQIDVSSRIDDMVRGKTTDGKIPYIKALCNDFADDRSVLAAELMALPDSFASGYLFSRQSMD